MNLILRKQHPEVIGELLSVLLKVWRDLLQRLRSSLQVVRIMSSVSLAACFFFGQLTPRLEVLALFISSSIYILRSKVYRLHKSAINGSYVTMLLEGFHRQ